MHHGFKACFGLPWISKAFQLQSLVDTRTLGFLERRWESKHPRPCATAEDGSINVM